MAAKRKLRPFYRRLTRRIGIAQLIVMALFSYFLYDGAVDIVTWEECGLYRNFLNGTEKDIKRILSDVYVGTMNHVPEIEENLDHPDNMYDIMERVVELNPHIRSCGVSFVADYYPQKGHWFCPYAVKGEDGTVERRTIGDAQHDYLHAEWFVEALKADSSYWSKPFFESNDTIIPLVSYMIPIHNKQGKTVAILGADLTITSGIMEVRAMGCTNFIIDQDGTYIAHPDSGFVINKNYFELAKATNDTIDDYIGRRMVAGESGTYTDKKGKECSFPYFDYDGGNAYLFFCPVEHTSWSIAIAVPSALINAVGIVVGIALLLMIGLALLVVRFVPATYDWSRLAGGAVCG